MLLESYDILLLKYAKGIEQSPRDCLWNDFFREDAHCATLEKATKDSYFSLKQITYSNMTLTFFPLKV